MLGRRAGSVYAQVQCRDPKTGQHKVQFYREDEIYSQSGYSLSMGWMQEREDLEKKERRKCMHDRSRRRDDGILKS